MLRIPRYAEGDLPESERADKDVLALADVPGNTSEETGDGGSAIEEFIHVAFGGLNAQIPQFLPSPPPYLRPSLLLPNAFSHPFQIAPIHPSIPYRAILYHHLNHSVI